MSTVNIPEQVEKMLLLRAKLNKAAETCNAEMSKLQEVLAKLSLGVEAMVAFDDGVTAYQLDYSRRRGSKKGWTFHIARGRNMGTGGTPSDVEVFEFLEAPRNVRVKAFLHVPALIQEIANNAEGEVASVEYESARVNEIAQSLLRLSEILD